MLSDILRLELQFMVKVMVTVQVSVNDRTVQTTSATPDLLLNMHMISGGGACLHCYRKLVSPAIQFLL